MPPQSADSPVKRGRLSRIRVVAWATYAVPMAPGHHNLCCGRGHSACSLEGRSHYHQRHDDGAGGGDLHVMRRIEDRRLSDGRANSVRTFLVQRGIDPVRMEAIDNAYSLYEMENGAAGTCHVGRIYHPVLPGTGGGSLQVYGTEGNLLLGSGYKASIVSTRRELLPEVDEEGWYHVPVRGDTSKAKWPQPTPGAFN